jgi:hypothetical protein
MAENKTKPTEQSVEAFLNAVPDERKRQDSFTVLEMMKEITGMQPQMWGSSIVGFGSVHYRYDSGREGDMPIIGFSPRKQNLTLYIMVGSERYNDLLQNLGKHSTGASCLYVKRLSDIDIAVLKALIAESFRYMNEERK